MTEAVALADLEFIPFLDTNGQLPAHLQAKPGVFGVFDQGKILQYVGYSRDISLTLQQVLVRCPRECYWLKVYVQTRPQRAFLEQTQGAWIEENGQIPPGNGPERCRWTEPVAVAPRLTPQEAQQLASAVTEADRGRVMKQAARRVEAEIFECLAQRGARLGVRFNPKLKESGFLDIS